MSESSEISERAWFAVARAPGLHADHLRPNLARGTTVEHLIARPMTDLLALGIPASAARWLSAPDWPQVEADRQWARATGVRLLALTDESYPPLLTLTADAPTVLWLRGNAEALSAVQIALVGSRRPTAGGRRIAESFAAGLSRAGFAITSGLAEGIDAAAHGGALAAGGLSIAVCGTGLDVCYPPCNAGLAARLAERGAVISEFPPGTPPLPHHFPRRNRIISGLSVGVLVIEAARRSGSLITARLAAEQGRHVMAVPGSIQSPVSAGCHDLIRNGAQLMDSVATVLEEVGWHPKISEVKPGVTEGGVVSLGGRTLDKASEMLLDALGFEPASIDDLIARTGQRAQEIAVGLMLLELEGQVETLPGGRYGRSTPADGK
jgi:DNA processing protein